MSGIIKEALADAKTVVSATEERAKDMFIKEFSPKLKSMLASVINEEVSTGADQPGGYEPEKDQDAIGADGAAEGTPNKNINKGSGDGPTVGVEGSGFDSAKDVREEGELDIEDDEEDAVMEQDEEDIEDTDEPVLEGEDELGLGDEELSDEEPVVEVGDEEEIEDDEVLEIVDDEEAIDAEVPGDEEELMEVLKRRNKKLNRENKQLREAVGFLRNKFKKVDLFNAKLAYAFKLMTQPGLTRSEKKQIAENFDAAKTVREAGLIYKTLKMRISKPKNPMKNVNVKGVISESTKIQGSNRLQELAGL